MLTPAKEDPTTTSRVAFDITDWLEAPIDLPAGAREFAIGDVHGHQPQLDRLLDTIASVANGEGHLTFLGDLIDRGPASIACLRRAASPAAELGVGACTLLLGNHEMLMLMALSGGPDAADAQDIWLANGGDTTLDEAGPLPSALVLRTASSRQAIERALGTAALERVAQAPLSRSVGNLLFVHAGIDPNTTLRAALDRPRLTLLDERHPSWIRGPFLDHAGPFEGGRIVVHGHTPEPRVLAMKRRPARPGWHRLDGWRLGLDGGSYATGVVTAAELQAGRYRVFTAQA